MTSTESKLISGNKTEAQDTRAPPWIFQMPYQISQHIEMILQLYLFTVHALLHVVDLVVLDLTVAYERHIPAETHGGGGRDHCMQVWSRTRYLDYYTGRRKICKTRL